MTSYTVLQTALLAAILQALSLPASLAANPVFLNVTIPGLDADGDLPDDAALCLPAINGLPAHGRDQSPAVGWSNAPATTKSFALIMTDPDVPLDVTLLRGPRPIPVEAARDTHYHWVLYDIPATTTSLPAGADGDGFAPRGKPVEKTQWGQRGVNANTWLMAGNPGLKGTYAGYDGPCPPVNDLKPHGYTITIYALDIDHLAAKPLMDGPDVQKAMEGHVLAKGEAVGHYSLNPALRKVIAE
ncbi:MAG: YbhB/YbcL family Raf kinase inhibitor-like protein [Candidatus Kaistia colombiensis]|nr:MAG: YbhB/YbcL family Raf kinase inhibitor-like protein [Kaistia sp.]